MSSYSTKIDEKWQKKWDETELYKFDTDNVEQKLYCLEMFSYPSGSNLHAGHWYNYGLTDSWARFKKLKGHEVFQPMGFDAFGLPAENYAIKTGIHPKDSTMNNIDTMEKQLKAMGAMFDWDYSVVTCDPKYYRWTQWLFLKLYENDLAFRKNAQVNWCPQCNTVLANEQVIEGFCERCENEVTKKKLTQWFFKITKYAEELLEGHKDIDWPEKTKAMQKNWIGKSIGSEITFKIVDKDINFTAFTTRPDTLFGVTYAVLAPENPLVDEITTKEYREQMDSYIEETKKRSEIERQASNDEKTGVFTGSFAINPINGEKIPVWVADYVLYSYGTGAVMAVPGHDERDFQFATKYELPIKRVIESSDDDSLPFTGEGKLVNSDEFDGLSWQDGKKAIIDKLNQSKLGKNKVQYKLRDWLVSRQRYWGAPIPIIYCDDCGVVPVPEKDLPVELPYDVDFSPDGISPLKKHEDFINTHCPKCGKEAKRETDTLDTFVDSSWYFLRYPDNENTEKPFDKEWIDKMLPVDKYVGGPEHACMHLLYARFIFKALRDMGYVSSSEPFKSLIHQGIILGPDGNKMSKSKGNVISPDSYIEEYGSDVFRLYLMFGFAYTEGGPWDENGIKPIKRFVDRIERIILTYLQNSSDSDDKQMGKEEKELNYLRHNTIKSVDNDTDKFQFNTSIARMMELLNGLFKYMETDKSKNLKLVREILEDFVIILAPHAPHFAEEMWEKLGMEYSVFNQQFPKYDERALVMDTQELAVQINGKVRGKIEVESGSSNEEIEKTALSNDKISANLEGKTVRKVIVIKGRIVNIVAS
ncbi:leucine--tRNA ligase [Proteinivorax hydrogeniformans]|uniref:Leucine--tRNA ligase n=1 Tax=Proteinivorax hydrogeniformans TaxID=1826727 RepID=A0AAU8HQL6_9FIRM